MARRTGSVRKLPSGRWQARLVDDAGHRHAIGTYPRQRDAQAALTAALAARDQGTYIKPTGITFAEAATRWLNTRLVRNSTLARDRSYVTNRLIPTFGAIPLAKITPHHARTWLADLTRQVSPATASKALQIASQICQQAVHDRQATSNPFATVKAPAIPPSGRRALTDTETRLLLSSTPPRWRAFVAVLATLGLRPGEAVALTIADVDLLHRKLTVNKTAGRPTGRLEVGQPKTRAGTRELPLSEPLVALLEEHIATYSTAEILFATETGKHIRLNEWRTRVWRPALRAAGIEETYPLHGLRHTALSAWVRNGLDIPTAVARAGHTSARTLLDIYAHESKVRSVADDRLDERAGTLLSGHAGGTTVSLDGWRGRMTSGNG